jgi:hypothetical protein
LTLSICAPEGKTTTLFFTVDCWLPGEDYSNYTFVVKGNKFFSQQIHIKFFPNIGNISINKFAFKFFPQHTFFFLTPSQGTDSSTWQYTPLTSIPTFDTYTQLVGASRLQTPADNTTEPFTNWIICDSAIYTCDATWMNAPASDSNLFWPLPNSVKSLGLSVLKSASEDWNDPSVYPAHLTKNTYMVSLVCILNCDDILNKFNYRILLIQLDMFGNIFSIEFVHPRTKKYFYKCEFVRSQHLIRNISNCFLVNWILYQWNPHPISRSLPPRQNRNRLPRKSHQLHRRTNQWTLHHLSTCYQLQLRYFCSSSK